MPSTSTQGVMGTQGALFNGVKPDVPSVRRQADLLLRFNEGLIDKPLTVQWLEFMAEFTDFYDFIDRTRHAESTRKWCHEWPSIKGVCNRLQDAAREIRAREDAERMGGRGW